MNNHYQKSFVKQTFQKIISWNDEMIISSEMMAYIFTDFLLEHMLFRKNMVYQNILG
jgi:hypothetical protein